MQKGFLVFKPVLAFAWGGGFSQWVGMLRPGFLFKVSLILSGVLPQ